MYSIWVTRQTVQPTFGAISPPIQSMTTYQGQTLNPDEFKDSFGDAAKQITKTPRTSVLCQALSKQQSQKRKNPVGQDPKLPTLDISSDNMLAVIKHNYPKQGTFTISINFKPVEAPIAAIQKAIEWAPNNIPSAATSRTKNALIEKLNNINAAVLANDIVRMSILSPLTEGRGGLRIRAVASEGFLTSNKDMFLSRTKQGHLGPEGTVSTKHGVFVPFKGPNIDDGLWWVQVTPVERIPEPVDWLLEVSRA